MASGYSGTTPVKTSGGTSGTKVGMARGTETATYSPLKGGGGGVPAATSGGQPYASNSASKGPVK